MATHLTTPGDYTTPDNEEFDVDDFGVNINGVDHQVTFTYEATCKGEVLASSIVFESVLVDGEDVDDDTLARVHNTPGLREMALDAARADYDLVVRHRALVEEAGW